MDSEKNRNELLDKMKKNAGSFDRFVPPQTKPELLNFRPDLKDAWTIQEHLVHVMESELALFLRVRQAIADPGSDARTGIPLESWMEKFDHSKQSVEDSVEAFKRLHLICHSLLKGFADSDWTAYYVQHPTRGKQTLDDILGILAGHVDFHLELIERNEKLWKEKG